ncbi:MAG: hypothetical protein GTO63_15485 [Anaerolineae bacterium]|nr:hypothetical protein [Anaerolineae bacterium]NIN96229.1 hypothetical protein [Anaerolineae bacterium]NIQ79250.1 hypothetical protein [Anaerolineae bacterium]
MRLQMTQRLTVGENEIAKYCRGPYEEAATKQKGSAERKAAEKWVNECGMIDTLKALPPEIYSMLPKGSYLVVGGMPSADGDRAIEIRGQYPLMKGLIAASKWDADVPGNTPVGIPPNLSDILKGNDRADEQWQDAHALAQRGAVIEQQIRDWLATTDMTTAEQFIWNAQPIAHLMHAIHAVPPISGTRRRYYRSRRYDAVEILLDIIADRRTLSRDKMRRPQKVYQIPDHITTLCGEAQVILASLPKRNQ